MKKDYEILKADLTAMIKSEYKSIKKFHDNNAYELQMNINNLYALLSQSRSISLKRMRQLCEMCDYEIVIKKKDA